MRLTERTGVFVRDAGQRHRAEAEKRGDDEQRRQQEERLSGDRCQADVGDGRVRRT